MLTDVVFVPNDAVKEVKSFNLIEENGVTKIEGDVSNLFNSYKPFLDNYLASLTW